MNTKHQGQSRDLSWWRNFVKDNGSLISFTIECLESLLYGICQSIIPTKTYVCSEIGTRYFGVIDHLTSLVKQGDGILLLFLLLFLQHHPCHGTLFEQVG